MCPDSGCPVGSFVEQDERIAAPRAKLTERACRWATEQLRREHTSVNGIRPQLGTGWRTVWESIKPALRRGAGPLSHLRSAPSRQSRQEAPEVRARGFYVSWLHIASSGPTVAVATKVMGIAPG